MKRWGHTHGNAVMEASMRETVFAPPRCAEQFRADRSPLAGTAPRSDGWLLITDRGPWAPQAITEHPTQAVAGAAIAERAKSEGLRPLLIRRHGRHHEERLFAVVDSLKGTCSWQPFESWADIVEAPWQVSAPVDQKVPAQEPVYLVCTHGARDACCAIDGRPIAAALQSLRPGATWECSHVGGHRLAANVVVLPEGIVYGAVTVHDVPALVSAAEARELLPRLLRGRCTHQPAVQAGIAAVARETGVLGLDQWQVVSVGQAAGQHWNLSLAAGDKVVDVVVRARESPTVASCGKDPTGSLHWKAEVQRVNPVSTAGTSD